MERKRTFKEKFFRKILVLFLCIFLLEVLTTLKQHSNTKKISWAETCSNFPLLYLVFVKSFLENFFILAKTRKIFM